MEKTKFIALMGLGLLALSGCAGGSGSSASVESGTPSLDPDLDEKQEFVSFLHSMAENPFDLAIGETTMTVAAGYVAGENGGTLLLDAYAGDTDKIAYPYEIGEGGIDLGIALTDADGAPLSALEGGIPAQFAEIGVDDISILDDGGATTENASVTSYFALGEDATGAIKMVLGENGLSVAFEGGFSLTVENVGTASDPTVESYLAEVGLPLASIAPANSTNIAYGNVYNSVTDFYAVTDGVIADTPEKTTMLDQGPTTIHLYTAEDPVGTILVRGEDGNTDQMSVTLGEDGVPTALTTTDYLPDGEQLPWSEAGLTVDYFDISGFRGTYDADALAEGGYDQIFQYYGWHAMDCYFSAVRESLPEGETITDIEITVPRDETPTDDMVSQIVFETKEEGNNGHLIVTTVSDDPVIPSLPEIQ